MFISSTAHVLYCHIPFCRAMCSYCAFNTYIDMDHLIEPYTQALIREIELTGEAAEAFTIETIFIGGGTPSMLSPDQLDRILQAAHRSLPVNPHAEISLETNPNDLNLGYLQDLKAIGFNRISIGMQSAAPSELALFNRRHKHEAVEASVQAARRAGFDNLNLDLIFGIPHQSLGSWQTSLKSAVRLAPDHLSLYGLELKGGTPLTLAVEAGLQPQPDDDLAADMYEFASDELQRLGYRQYEISNWCKPDHECRHNLQYWRNLPYIGLGAGAHGFAGGMRTQTITAPVRYIDALLTAAPGNHPFPHTPAVARAVAVDRDTEIADTVMMGLRLTREGIQRQVFQARFGVDLAALHPETIVKFQGYGMLHVDDDHIRLTDAGRLLSNAVIRELI